MSDSNSLSRAAEWIRESSFILIAAGAGLSAAAVNPQYGVSLDYTSEEAFRRLYPRMVQVSNMRCMYDAIGKHDWHPELMWGYLFTHANVCRYNWGATAVYQDLKDILNHHANDSFVVTTNADGMFEQNKFVSYSTLVTIQSVCIQNFNIPREFNLGHDTLSQYTR